MEEIFKEHASFCTKGMRNLPKLPGASLNLFHCDSRPVLKTGLPCQSPNTRTINRAIRQIPIDSSGSLLGCIYCHTGPTARQALKVKTICPWNAGNFPGARCFYGSLIRILIEIAIPTRHPRKIQCEYLSYHGSLRLTNHLPALLDIISSHLSYNKNFD